MMSGFFAAPKSRSQQHPRKIGQGKGTKKVTHQDESPTSEEKLRKQTNNIMRSEVSNLTTQQQISYDQLIKEVLDLQEEVKKLKKDNKKLMEKLELAEEIESRLMTQEGDLNAFQIYHKT